MHLVKETSRSLPRVTEQKTEIAIPNIINKRTINGIQYLVLIVLLVLVIDGQVLNAATEKAKSLRYSSCR